MERTALRTREALRRNGAQRHSLVASRATERL